MMTSNSQHMCPTGNVHGFIAIACANEYIRLSRYRVTEIGP